MSIIVYQDVGTPIIPAGDLAGPVRDALGGSLRSMRYVTPDFAGLYQNATGTTPVTAVGQPVGLMLDRRFGLARGGTLPLDAANANWQLGQNAIAEKVAVGFSQLRAIGVAVIGKVYEAVVEVISGNGETLTLYKTTPSGGSGVLAAVPYTQNPVFRYIFTIENTNDRIAFLDGNAFLGAVRFSVRELPGNHASQTTTTARPTLRSGPLRIDYDGVDDYLRTVFPDLGSNVTIARSIPGTGAQILTGQTIAAGNWDDNVDSCATLVIDRPLTDSETALVTAFLNQQAGV